MNETEFLAIFEEALELTPGSVSKNQMLEDVMEWDSLSVLALIALIDERLNVSLSGQLVSEAKTISDLMNLLS